MKRRKDPAAGARLRNGAAYFGVAMVGLGGSLAWVILTAQGGKDEGWASVAVLFFLVAVFLATVNIFRAVIVYRCPKCRRSTRRVPDATPGAPVLYRCLACNIEWDSGWTVAADSSD